MSILAPTWLMLLIPAVVLLYLFRPPTRTLTILRAIALLLVILAMSRIALNLSSKSGTLVVIADRSASMRPEHLRNQEEIIKLAADAMDSQQQLAVISSARHAIVDHPPQSGAFGGFVSKTSPDQSNLGIAIQKALNLIPHNGTGRILLLSDGNWTGIDPFSIAGKAAASNIGIDYRLQTKTSVNDLAIDRISCPEQLTPQESFMLTAWVRSPIRQEISYELTRGNSKLAAGKRQLKTGMNRLVFRDTANSPSTQQYTLTVKGEHEDSQPENNSAKILVNIQGSRPLLCISSTKQNSFSAMLKAGKLDIETLHPGSARWTLANLSNYSGIILENIPANEIGPHGMEMLSAWVEDSGSGLMMTGGKNSYGPGGYFKSPLERILPVSMELKKEHRKFNLAIVITMDRSGSMGAAAGNGKTKMDLANIGSVQVMDLLSDYDEIGVIAVDSSPHTIVNLNIVEVNRGQRQRILKIESMGGGIFVYEGLQAATRMLLKAEAETRHIILFSDAADSEEPGKYVELLTKCKSANITCSVIALGTESDCDADLLKDVARIGGGHCYFSNDAMEIPRLFAQDTFTVSRSAMVDEPTQTKFTSGYSLLANTLPPNAPQIGGYNLCYIRPDANLAAITTDEYQAPVIATWQAGRGRVLCYTGEADGEHTGAIAKWPHVGELFSSMARWVAGDTKALGSDMMVVQNLDAGVCRIELHLDPERKKTPFNGLPYVNLLHGIPGTVPDRTRLNMKWASADTLAIDFPLYGSETVLPTMHIEGQSPSVLAPVCLPYSPEFRPPQAGRGFETLRRLAKITGGKERGDISTIWDSLPRQKRMIEISHWLYILAIITLLIDVLQRRTGIFANIHKPTNLTINLKKSEPRPQKQKTKHKAAKQKAAPIQAKAPEEKPQDNESTISAMQKAHRRAKHRTKR